MKPVVLELQAIFLSNNTKVPLKIKDQGLMSA